MGAVSSTPLPGICCWNGSSVAKVKHKDLFFCWLQQGWAQQREQAVEERQEVNLFSVGGFDLSFDLSCY